MFDLSLEIGSPGFVLVESSLLWLALGLGLGVRFCLQILLCGVSDGERIHTMCLDIVLLAATFVRGVGEMWPNPKQVRPF